MVSSPTSRHFLLLLPHFAAWPQIELLGTPTAAVAPSLLWISSSMVGKRCGVDRRWGQDAVRWLPPGTQHIGYSTTPTPPFLSLPVAQIHVVRVPEVSGDGEGQIWYIRACGSFRHPTARALWRAGGRRSWLRRLAAGASPPVLRSSMSPIPLVSVCLGPASCDLLLACPCRMDFLGHSIFWVVSLISECPWQTLDWATGHC